jgi:hypothetical protein
MEQVLKQTRNERQKIVAQIEEKPATHTSSSRDLQQKVGRLDRLISLWEQLESIQQKFPHVQYLPRVEFEGWECDGMLLSSHAIYVFHLLPEKIDQLKIPYPELQVNCTEWYEENVERVLRTWTMGTSRTKLNDIRKRLGLPTTTVYEFYVAANHYPKLRHILEETLVASSSVIEKILSSLTYKENDSMFANQLIFYRFFTYHHVSSEDKAERQRMYVANLKKYKESVVKEKELWEKVRVCEADLEEVNQSIITHITKHYEAKEQHNTVQLEIKKLRKPFASFLATFTFQSTRLRKKRKQMREKSVILYSDMQQEEEMIQRLKGHAKKLNKRKSELHEQWKNVRMDVELAGREIHEVARFSLLN